MAGGERLMPLLIDASLWIDFTRARSPQALKRFIAPFILRPDACVAEPVAFEILRHATPAEHALLTRQFRTMPTLRSPPDLWPRAADLGRTCRRSGITAGSIDLLIATIAIAHEAEMITFDADFSAIAGVSPLRLKLLVRPRP